CSHAALSPSSPGAPGPRVVAMISASTEWKVLRAQLPEAPQRDTPFGEWLIHRLGGPGGRFFHGGLRQGPAARPAPVAHRPPAAAGSPQYAIDRWHPALLVNLGTCGGFGGERKVGDVVLASETTIYDIVELMGNPDEAIADFRTRLDTSAWPARLAGRVVVGPIVSADRDLDPAAVAGLAAKYHPGAGGRESGAVAWVAAHNPTPV